MALDGHRRWVPQGVDGQTDVWLCMLVS